MTVGRFARCNLFAKLKRVRRQGVRLGWHLLPDSFMLREVLYMTRRYHISVYQRMTVGR